MDTEELIEAMRVVARACYGDSNDAEIAALQEALDIAIGLLRGAGAELDPDEWEPSEEEMEENGWL